MPTICSTGAISSARNAEKVTNEPMVMLPFRMRCAPRKIIKPLTTPRIIVDARLITEVAVSVLRMFSSKRCTLRPNTCSSRSSA